MNRFKLLTTVLVCGVVLSPSFRDASAAEIPTKPNLIFLMVDDMGKDSVGCYGRARGKSGKTPVVDQLAATGMRFSNFYSMPQCTPSRVSLLTAQYPYRNGWVNHYDVPRWNLKGFNPKSNPCLGNVMKSAGYATCISGKWQINDFREQLKE